MRRLLAVAAMVLTSCAVSLGRVGVIGPSDRATAVKALRPAAEGRSCQSSFLGVPLGAASPTLESSLAHVLALDREGDVVTNAEIVMEEFVTGLYNRRCLVVRGDLGRIIREVRVPGHGEHGAHH